MNGADEFRFQYNVRAVAMAERIKLFEPSPGLSKKEQDARAFAAWVLYAWQGYVMWQRSFLNSWVATNRCKALIAT